MPRRRRSTSPKSTSPASRTRSGRAYNSDSISSRSRPNHSLSNAYAVLPDILSDDASLHQSPVSGLRSLHANTPVSPLLASNQDTRWNDLAVPVFGNTECNNLGDVVSDELEKEERGIGLSVGPLAAEKLVGKRCTPSVRGNDKENVEAETNNQSHMNPVTPPNWISLFNTLPIVAGNFTPQESFETKVVNGRCVMPDDVHQVGANYWADYLVGFFLDTSPSYQVVREKCNRFWRLRGKLHVQFFDSMFYLKFSHQEDKMSVLERDPLIIEGKPFIITPWSVTVGKAREQILSIPVWATLTNIPSVLQPLIGINWLASLIGKLRCLDSNTVARKSMKFARALIEITPSVPLPDKLKVTLVEGFDVDIDVEYSWRPEICPKCRTFGHNDETCPIPAESLDYHAAKIPLHKPIMLWKPKAKVIASPSHTVVQGSPTDIDKPSSPPASNVNPDIPAAVVANDNALELDPPTSNASTPDYVTSNSEEPATSNAPVVTDTSTAKSDFAWSPHECAWVHKQTDMCYQPDTNLFYSYVSGVHGENRFLWYSVVDEELTLTTEGINGAANEEILKDGTWDRNFIYNKQSVPYFPNFAALFAPFRNVIGPCDVVGD